MINVTKNTAIPYYRAMITILGFAALLLASLLLPVTSPNFIVLGGITFFIGFLANFPLKLLLSEITLLQVVILGSGMLYGAVPVAWAAVIGILCGNLARYYRTHTGPRKWSLPPGWWLEASFTIGINILPLIIINPSLGWVEKFNLNPSAANQVWTTALLPAAVYALLHGFLFLFNYFLQSDQYKNSFRRDLVSLSLIEFIPVPLILLALEAYPSIEDKAVLAIGLIPMILSVMMNRTVEAQAAQERRILELSTIDRVSETMRSTLDLGDLLPVIQQQVTQILDVDNFYVALYDKDTHELWYPLAIKYGRRQNWSRRPIADRLTDRVILERKPILLTPQTQAGPDPIGLPPSEATPVSWLGVPLIVSEQAIGCLAVSGFTAEVEFTSADMDLLTILSGQISVAIDNALLYEQAQHRATQLETLSRLTGTITGSLNLQEVLEHVCSSASLVAGSLSSAVFLLEPGEDKVWLAYAHNTTEGFSRRNSQFSIARSKRTRCLRTGNPIIISDIQSSSLTIDLIQLFRADNIRALADFPLVTPEGQIGFLSVFFKKPHIFQREETDLLQTFASQAALAVSNARMHALTGEQLSRRVHQLAILEAVGRELSAASHSDSLFQLILDYALEFTHSLCGAVALYHSESAELEMKASRGYDTNQSRYPVSEGLSGKAIRLKETINDGDVYKNPDFVDLRNLGTRSQLSVPIIHEKRALGVITLESAEIDAFDESEQSLVVQLANQAAISIVNADLYHRSQRSLRELSTLYQISNRLVGMLSVRDVIDVLEISLNALFGANVVGIYLPREDNARFVLWQSASAQTRAAGNLPDAIFYEDFHSLALDDAAMRHVRLTKDSPEIKIFTGGIANHSVTLFPLISDHRWIGLVVLQEVEDFIIQEHELALVGAILAQCEIALQNSRLFSDATNGRNRLSALVNSVGEGILMVDTQGTVLFVNEPFCDFTGISHARLEQTCIAELPEDALKVIGYSRERLVQVQEELGNGQIPAPQKIEFRVPDRTPILVLSRETSPVLGSDNKAIGWMIVLRDQTEDYEIQKAREVITETLVHDLRSPMSAVVGAIDLMDVTLPKDGRDAVLEQSMRVAHSGSRRVLGLIEALLDISHLQSGQLGLDMVPMDLRSIVEGLMPDFTLMANEYGLILRNEIPEGLPVITADQDKVVRVISNLLDNAIKFTPSGGQVKISATKNSHDFVAIQVADSGPGIPEEYREKVFERFWQVPGQRTRRRGSGLGLAFCRLAIEAHGGKIWVDSPKGTGSIFTFTLPMRDAPG